MWEESVIYQRAKSTMRFCCLLYTSYLSQAYPDAYIKLKRYNLMFKKYPIEAQFLGPDPAVLHQLADSARTIMENTPVSYTHLDVYKRQAYFRKKSATAIWPS